MLQVSVDSHLNPTQRNTHHWYMIDQKGTQHTQKGISML